MANSFGRIGFYYGCAAVVVSVAVYIAALAGVEMSTPPGAWIVAALFPHCYFYQGLFGMYWAKRPPAVARTPRRIDVSGAALFLSYAVLLVHVLLGTWMMYGPWGGPVRELLHRGMGPWMLIATSVNIATGYGIGVRHPFRWVRGDEDYTDC